MMEPLIGLSLLAGGLWMMASLYHYAADRGMPIPGRGNGRESLPIGQPVRALLAEARAAIELKF
jgi:hypothetical protein